MTGERPIRVAEVMECTIGGTRRHIGELTTGLARRGFDVTLFASAERDKTFQDDLERIAAAGVKVTTLPMRREISPLRDAWHQLRLIAAFLRGGFDVVHTHSSKAGALGRVAARIAARRAAIVHTPHTFAFNFAEQFSARKRKMFLGVERFLGRVTDRMIHVSRSERLEGIGLGIIAEERAIVVENGVDPRPYEEAALHRAVVRKELSIAEDALLVGAVGLLNEAKGHDYLVAAMERVRAVLPHAQCVIVGEGALRPSLEDKIARMSPPGGVRLLGYRRDVPRVLAALDVFAMPSLWEGMPYGVLEAMASGLPVIASDVNGCRDLVADEVTGLLIPARDSMALANGLLRLLRDEPLRARLGAAGRKLVATRYSLETMIDHYAELFRSLCRRTGTTS